MSHRIGEIAAQAGVTVEAIRYYERIGLLAKPPRTQTGNRRYPDEAIVRVRFVKQAQANGFTLAEIRELIGVAQRTGTRRCKHVLRLLAAKLADIEQRQAQLEAFRRTLQSFADECERSLQQTPDPDCPVISRMARS